MTKRTALGLLTLVAMLCSTVSLAQLEHVDRARSYHRAACETNNGMQRDGHISRHGVVRRDDESTVRHVSPVAAPELDSTFSTSALALLVGCVAILRARRQTRNAA